MPQYFFTSGTVLNVESSLMCKETLERPQVLRCWTRRSEAGAPYSGDIAKALSENVN